MRLRQPNIDGIQDLVIDDALRHVSNFYVLKTLIATGNWSKSFGLGGCSCESLTWDGNSKGIKWRSKDEHGVNSGEISISAILSRAYKWIDNDIHDQALSGQQLSLF